jgi:hypothetical protein
MVLQASPPHNHQHHNTFQAQEIQIMIFTWSLLWFSKLIIITDTTGKCKFAVRSHFAVRFITGRTVKRTFAVRPVQSARQTLGAR